MWEWRKGERIYPKKNRGGGGRSPAGSLPLLRLVRCIVRPRRHAYCTFCCLEAAFARRKRRKAAGGKCKSRISPRSPPRSRWELGIGGCIGLAAQVARGFYQFRQAEETPRKFAARDIKPVHVQPHCSFRSSRPLRLHVARLNMHIVLSAARKLLSRAESSQRQRGENARAAFPPGPPRSRWELGIGGCIGLAAQVARGFYEFQQAEETPRKFAARDIRPVHVQPHCSFRSSCPLRLPRSQH